MKKFLSILLAAMMLLSVASFASAEQALPTFDQIVLGENTDLTATIKFLNHRTDLEERLAEYVAEFNKIYPNITVEYDLLTDYAEISLTRLSAGNWGTIMGIPTVDKDELATYFVPMGDTATLSESYNFVVDQSYEGISYGIPSTGNAQGIVYNKAVFEKAGVTELPKTPEEFMAALQAIKDNTDAIPLYTNYAAGWTMGAWDAYIGSATGDPAMKNQILPHTLAPFADPGDGTGLYNVYKILYDASAQKLIEDDYSTTDWEGCKGMINAGEIGCMVLGSWAYSQMVEAGPNGDDIGYMSFPITVDGKQYAAAGGDYNYAISVEASYEEQLAAMYYIKWLTHESGFSFTEGGIPINKDGEYPALYSAFEEVEFVENLPALPGEDTYLGEINAESEINLDNGGNTKVQELVENGFNGTKSFDDMMTEWNTAWADAIESLGYEAQ